MKNILYIFVLTALLTSCGSMLSYAAMSEDVSADNIVDAVVHERFKAMQEYQLYQIEKQKQKQAAQEQKPSVISEQDTLYKKSKKGIILSAGLIILAVILTLYMFRISKK